MDVLIISMDLQYYAASAQYTGCLKINETHEIADEYVDFNPIFLYFSDLIAVINNNYYFKTPWLGN